MRVVVAVVAAGLLAGTGVGPVVPAAAASPRPSSPAGVAAGAATSLPADDGSDTVVSSQPVAPVAAGAERTTASGADVVAELAPTQIEPFGLLGITWDPATTPAGIDIEVQVHTADGWGAWKHVEYVFDEGPAATEESDARAGTTPLWVGSADGAAVRMTSSTGTAPADVRLVTVDPEIDGLSSADRASGVTRSAAKSVAQRRPSSGDAIKGSPRFPALPRLITRRQWGADPAMTESCYPPRYGRSAKMVFVHHTAGSSRYTVSESPAIVRSILAYHTQAQDWCDIGYNALIDRFGNIYEGRRGGIRKPVRGAHSGDYNTNSVGVSLMGNFQKAEPSRRILNALVRFIGWRLGTSFSPVRGAVRLNGARFARISGHRDAMSTSCPGGNVYDRIPHIRRRVVHYLDDYESAAKRKAGRLGDRTTGKVFMGEQGAHGGTYTVFTKGRIYASSGPGVHWLSGRPLSVFRKARGVSGPLGWPTIDPRSIVGRWAMVAFGNGRIYLRAGRPARVLYGRIVDRYAKLDYHRGRLGLPTSGIRKVTGGHRARFQHGTLRWHRSSNRVTVRWH